MNILIFWLNYVFTALFLIALGFSSLIGLNALFKPKWFHALQKCLSHLTFLYLPLGLCFVLVLFLQKSFFPWASLESNFNSFQSRYYSEPAFACRGLVYIALLSILSRLYRLRKKINAPICLATLLFFGSFASYDWIMSQSHDFHSTLFGLLTIVTGTLIVHALSLSRLKEEVDTDLLVDVNNVHLTLIALWVYLVIMQYITVWSANLPEESAYFKLRFHGILGTLASIILLVQIFIPIPLLLFKKLKRQLAFTRRLALLTLCLQALHLFWLLGGLP
jgi:hypothetical protein